MVSLEADKDKDDHAKGDKSPHRRGRGKRHKRASETSSMSEDLVTPSVLETLLGELRVEMEEVTNKASEALIIRIETELGPMREA